MDFSFVSIVIIYVKGEMNGSAGGGVLDNEKKIAAMEQQIEELK